MVRQIRFECLKTNFPPFQFLKNACYIETNVNLLDNNFGLGYAQIQSLFM